MSNILLQFRPARRFASNPARERHRDRAGCEKLIATVFLLLAEAPLRQVPSSASYIQSAFGYGQAQVNTLFILLLRPSLDQRR